MNAREPMRGTLKTQDLTVPGLLLTWSLSLVAFRVLRTGSPNFLFLPWNLFLACVPLAASRTLRVINQRGASRLAQGALFCLWLLFLPNAPYIVTDLVHVHPPVGIGSWYDTGLVLSCATAGLLVGYLSLRDIQRLVEESFGTTAGWLMASGALLLSGFGVYLGRVLRWNSWDVVTNPIGLFGSIANLLLHTRLHLHTYAMTLLFGLGLLVGYAALHWVAATDRDTRARL